jgi:fumarate reductase subunit C
MYSDYHTINKLLLLSTVTFFMMFCNEVKLSKDDKNNKRNIRKPIFLCLSIISIIVFAIRCTNLF